MELVNLINNNDTNVKELFKSKNCNIHEYDSNILVKYPHKVTIDNGEGGWLKYCRGAVYNNNKVLYVPPVRFLNGEPENIENYSIQEYLDGTLIAVWYNEDKEKWYISTRSRIGALCRWQNSKTFRSMFFQILNENNGDFDILDKSLGYTFVMIHTDNRIVQKYNNNRIVLVSAWNKELNTYCDISTIPEKAKDIALSDNIWFSLPKEYTIAEYKDSFNNNSVNNLAGFTFISENIRCKIMHPDYERCKQLHGESHIPMFNYLYNRKNGKIPEYLKIYPENRRHYNHMKYKVHDFTQDLYDTYGSVFKEKRIILQMAPFSMKPFLYELHGLYLKTKEAIAFSNVMEYINQQPTARLYFAMSKYSKEQEEKNNNMNDTIVNQIINDNVNDIISNINDDSEINDNDINDNNNDNNNDINDINDINDTNDINEVNIIEQP